MNPNNNNNNNNKNNIRFYNNKFELLFIITMMCCFIFSCIYTVRRNNVFYKSGGYNLLLEAIVTDKYIKQGKTLNYKYVYGGKEYHENEKGVMNDYYYSINIGDTITIMVNNELVDYSLVFYHKNKHRWNGKN